MPVLISMQMGEYDRAERELQLTLSKGGKEESTVHYYLAQLNEARQNDATALFHYRLVKDSEYSYAARLREVALLDKAGKLDEAREVLHRAVAKTDSQRAQVIMIDAQLLREVGFEVWSTTVRRGDGDRASHCRPPVVPRGDATGIL